MPKVDPRYFEYPLWRLIIEFGHDWIREQEELFMSIYEGRKIPVINQEYSGEGSCNILV